MDTTHKPAPTTAHAAWQQGYEFALTHLSDEPVQADRARYLTGGTDTTPTIPVDPCGTTYMHLDHGPWEPSGLECGDIEPTHTHCEQPVQQRTVTAVYPLGQRIHLGVELQPHDQHASDNT